MAGGMRGFTTRQSLIRIFSVWILAFLVPKIYVWVWQPKASVHPSLVACTNGAMQSADLMFAMRTHNPGVGAPRSVALVAGDLAKLHACAATADMLVKKGFRIKKIFVPWYTAASGKTMSVGKARRIPIERIPSDGVFTKRQIHGVDLLVFAMQDSRREHGVYAATLAQTMKAASVYKKMLVIMDHHHEGDVVPFMEHSLKQYAQVTGGSLTESLEKLVAI